MLPVIHQVKPFIENNLLVLIPGAPQFQGASHMLDELRLQKWNSFSSNLPFKYYKHRKSANAGIIATVLYFPHLKVPLVQVQSHGSSHGTQHRGQQLSPENS